LDRILGPTLLLRIISATLLGEKNPANDFDARDYCLSSVIRVFINHIVMFLSSMDRDVVPASWKLDTGSNIFYDFLRSLCLFVIVLVLTYLAKIKLKARKNHVT